MLKITSKPALLAAVLLANLPMQSAETAAPVRIMPLGDSITEGFYNDLPNDGSYRNHLYDLLTTDGFNVDFVGTWQDVNNPGMPDIDHQGIPGIQIDGLRESLGHWLKSVEDPDVILVHAGTNDFAAGATPAQAISRTKKLIEDLSKARPYAEILVANLILRTDVPALQTKQSEFASVLPQLIVEQQTLGRRVHLVDMQSALLPSDLLDGLHPNSSGYTKMAEVWRNAINLVIAPDGSDEPPAIIRVDARESLTEVTVTFSKPVEDAAASVANFAISGGVTVSGATLDPVGKRKITLTTSTRAAGAVHTLTVNGVKDRTMAALEIEAGSNVDFATTPLLNGSFESGSGSWTTSGNLAVVDNVSYPDVPASDGIAFIAFNAANSSPDGQLSQPLATQPGQKYRLTFDVGAVGNPSASQKLKVRVNGGTTLLAHTEFAKPKADGSENWRVISLDFTADAGPVTLTFEDDSDSTNGIDMFLDDVRLEVALESAGTEQSLVINGSFETGDILPGDAETTLSGWSVSGNVVGLLSNAPTYAPSDGSRLAGFNAGNNSFAGEISATLPLATTPGATYLLAFDLGITGTAGKQLRMGVSVEGNLLNRSWQEDIEASGTAATWQPKAYTFVADSTETTLSFTDLSFQLSPSLTDSCDLLLDNVRVLESVVRTLQVESSGTSGVAVAIDPADNNEAGGGTTNFNRAYAKGSIVTLSAPYAAGGKVFKKWQRNGLDLTTETATSLEIVGNEILSAVYGDNVAPTAVADSYIVEAGTALTVSPAAGVLANDTDVESNPLTAALDTNTTQGTLTLDADGGFTYTPGPAFTGTDTFTYHANDGAANSPVPATVTLTVVPKSGGLLANGGFEVGAPGDFGPLDNWASVSGDAFGLTANTYPGSATYTPAEGNRLAVFNGSNNIYDEIVTQDFPTVIGQTYLVQYQLGAAGQAGRVQKLGVSIASGAMTGDWQETIATIGPNSSNWQNKAFVFVADALETTITFTDLSGETGNSINSDLLLDNVRVNLAGISTLSVESTPVTSLAITVSPADNNTLGDGTTNFTRSYADGTIVTLTAPPMAGGSPFEKWQLDGLDYDFDPTAVITVAGNRTLTAVYIPNQPPVATDDSYVTEDGLVLTVPAAEGLLENDTDSDDDPLTASLASGATEGLAVVNPDGGFNYDPDPAHSGSDTFTYLANDGVVDSAPANVSVTVLPRSGGLLVNGGFEVGLPLYDGTLDGWTVLNGGPFGSAEDSTSIYATYTPTQGDRMALFNGYSDTFTDEISQTFPTVVGQTYELEFDLGITGEIGRKQKLGISISGAAGSPWEESIISAGPLQTFWESKSIVFVATGTTTTLNLRDLSGETGNAINADMLIDDVRINAVGTGNLAPAFTVDPIVGTGATEDSAYTGTLAGSASDPNVGDTLTYSLVSTPTWLSVASDGTLSGTPTNAHVGLNQFTVRVTDGGLLFDDATLEITVIAAPGNDLDDWLDEYAITDDLQFDTDGDGISNLVEYIIGGDPAERMDADLLPTGQLVTADPDNNTIPSEYLLFTYRRAVRASDNPEVGIDVEWNTGLGAAWNMASDTLGVEIVVETLEEGVMELVKVYIPRGLEADGRLFARLTASHAAQE